MSHNDFKTGQKWISSAEPDLGIGQVIMSDDRLIQIQFDLADELRTYAKHQAPLARVKFAAGDRIKTVSGITISVTDVSEHDGIFIYRGIYQGTNTSIIETELDPNISFSKPEERLFTHQTDSNRWFNLRYRTLNHQARLAALPVRGLLSPRVALIPHQLYIANDVATRYAPRVLLADEVGLGKTIEAGLIIHQQLTTGKASRILIIVPAALTFQWFVEMIRRFNLQFTLLDEDRCLEIEADNLPANNPGEHELDNPFEAQQLALCSLDLFLSNKHRLAQAIESNWDLIVVDEAHHLDWTENSPSKEYKAVEALASEARGLLLLTATPEQLGRLGHFSRLKLLDPNRYHSFQTFLEEEESYEDVAALIDQISNQGSNLVEATRQQIRQRLGVREPQTDDALVRSLLDRHGTGRVLFRNVRESVDGFPRRELCTYELSPEGFPKTLASHLELKDPRIDWLINLLQDIGKKVLVICASSETAIFLEKRIRKGTAIRSAAFHEGMDLIARDRAANYFADEERGAQVLICSEIGSEGRNFQFAHHLVMFDLPASPDLVEQRIGRLDRIGQKHDVSIHIPFAHQTEQYHLLRIFDDGFELFSQPNVAAQIIYEEFNDIHANGLEERVTLIREASEKRLSLLSQGRDRLIELNSHRSEISSDLLNQITFEDNSSDLEDYIEESFEMFGLESELLSEKIYIVRPTERMTRQSPISAETQDRYRYPELPDEGITFTYDRSTALAREDVQFISWEHPLIEQAMELVSTNLIGNCCFIVVNAPGVKAGTMLLESLHITECVAPAEIQAAQYLPPAIVRSLVTIEGTDLADQLAFQTWNNTVDIDKETTAKILSQQETVIRQLTRHAEKAAEEKFLPIRQSALRDMKLNLEEEITRLEALAKVNPNIRHDEIDFLVKRKETLSVAISQSQIRLDAVRLILVA